MPSSWKHSDTHTHTHTKFKKYSAFFHNMCIIVILMILIWLTDSSLWHFCFLLALKYPFTYLLTQKK